MELDPRRLLVLRAVALRGSITDAGRLLHITPSAVSQQLTQLEQEVGVPLLDRSQRRAALTQAGSLLAARGERIAQELAGARDELAALSQRFTGTATVATFSTVIRHLFVPAQRDLARSHPGLQLRAVELEGPPALRELRTGGVDLVVAERDSAEDPPRHPGLAWVTLTEDGYRVVVPAAWQPTPRSMRELASRPWISSPPEGAASGVLDRLAERSQFSPLRAHVSLEFPTVLALVAAGLGAAIVPGLALGRECLDQVRIAPIPTGAARSLDAWYRSAGSDPEPLAACLIAALRAAAEARRENESAHHEVG
jgi:DNA-binding transcriptional LysR family regulator